MAGLESLHVMALFTTILVRRALELALVDVLVAVLAPRLDNLEERVLSLRQMAFVASHLRMEAFERVFRRLVVLDGESRRFEAIHGMADSALGAAGPFEELSAVIVLVTIHALCKWYLCLEVPVLMAIFASHRFVLAEQRVFRFRVVESLQPFDLFPASGVMTRLAGLGKATLMRIGVTCRAFRERESRVLDERLCVRHRRMALRAGNFLVRPGQGIFRRRMIEEWCGLPAIGGVAALAIITQLAPMRIGVTRQAGLRQSKKGLGKLFHLDKTLLGRNHVRWRVAFLAGHARVLSFQVIAGQPVVELFQ